MQLQKKYPLPVPAYEVALSSKIHLIFMQITLNNSRASWLMAQFYSGIDKFGGYIAFSFSFSLLFFLFYFFFTQGEVKLEMLKEKFMNIIFT